MQCFIQIVTVMIKGPRLVIGHARVTCLVNPQADRNQYYQNKQRGTDHLAPRKTAPDRYAFPGMDPVGGGRQCIRANVPEAEVLRYSTDLRSISSGHGTYEMKFSHYDEVPAHVGKALIEAYEKSRSEDN